MNFYPLITIITVSYNAVKTIAETINSVASQTYPNIEYIIIDGGSTDGTLQILSNNKCKISNWISEHDQGIYDAMNKGLKIANGEWCIFMGADDVFYNKYAIENMVQHFTDKNNIYYGNVIMKTTKQIYPNKKLSAFKLCRKNICHQSIFYPKNIYKNYTYNLQYPIWADWLYNIQQYSRIPHNFIYINSIVSIFNDNGASEKGDDAFLKDRWKIINTHMGKVYLCLLWSGYNVKQLFKKIQANLNFTRL